MMLQAMLLFLLVTSSSRSIVLVQQQLEEDTLVADFITQHLQQHIFPGCFMNLDTDEKVLSTALQGIIHHQSILYQLVIISHMQASFHVSYSDYPTIWKEEHLYSFRTMPVDLLSEDWNGGKCAFNILLATSPSKVSQLVLHAASTFRFHHLVDPTLIHVRSGSNPEAIMLQNPTRGITYKIMSQYDKKSAQLVLHNVCYNCNAADHKINTPIMYPKHKSLNPDQFFPIPNMNLHGRKLILGHFESVDMDRARKLAHDPASLSMEEISLLAVEKMYNITIKVVVPEFTPEDFYPNGSYSGFTAALCSGQIDWSLVQYYTENSIRATVLPTPYIYFHLSFATRHPRPDVKWYILTQPFEWRVWLAILVTLVVSAYTMTVLDKQERQLRKRVGQLHFMSMYISKIKLLLRELVEQCASPGQYMSVRVFYVTILVFALVMVCGYKAKIVAFLTWPETEVLPNTFQELHASMMPLGTGMILRVFIGFGVAKAGIQMFQDLYDRSETTTSFHQCLEKAVHEDFACVLADYLYHRESVYFMDYDGQPMVRWSPEQYFNSFTAPASPRDDVIAKRAHRLLDYAREGGLSMRREKITNAFKMIKHYSRMRQLGVKLVSSTVEAFRIDQLETIVVVWMLGLIISCFALLMELVTVRFSKRSRKVDSIGIKEGHVYPFLR